MPFHTSKINQHNPKTTNQIHQPKQPAEGKLNCESDMVNMIKVQFHHLVSNYIQNPNS